MYDSKLLELCKALTNKELAKFSLYIESPLYNTSDKVIQLFDLLKNYHPHYQDTSLSRKIVAERLFSNYKNADSQLRSTMTQLTKLLKDFFIWTELEEAESTRDERLLMALYKRQLHDVFKKEAEIIFEKLRQVTYKNDDHYRDLFNISSIVFVYHSEYYNRTPDKGFQELMNNLDLSFITTKLKYAVAMRNRQNILGESIDSKSFNDILNYIEQSTYYQLPFVMLYYYSYMLLASQENTDSYYWKLRALLRENTQIVPISELRDIYIVVTNYCIRALKKGRNEFSIELFELYDEMLKRNIRSDDGFISPHNYSNIIVNALKLKRFQWAKQFIHDYKHQVQPEGRENAYNYGLAMYYFYLKDYDKTLDYIAAMNIEDTYDALHAKVLYIKTFYEKNETISLQAALESMRIYLIRDKTISEYNINTYKNFKNFVSKLYRIKEGGQKKPMAIIEEMKQCDALAEAQWLLEKAIELMKDF